MRGFDLNRTVWVEDEAATIGKVRMSVDESAASIRRSPYLVPTHLSVCPPRHDSNKTSLRYDHPLPRSPLLSFQLHIPRSLWEAMLSSPRYFVLLPFKERVMEQDRISWMSTPCATGAAHVER
eukprot:767604-Hanusia_phi.AAC.1